MRLGGSPSNDKTCTVRILLVWFWCNNRINQESMKWSKADFFCSYYVRYASNNDFCLILVIRGEKILIVGGSGTQNFDFVWSGDINYWFLVVRVLVVQGQQILICLWSWHIKFWFSESWIENIDFSWSGVWNIHFG